MFKTIRGVQIPEIQVKQVEDEFGAKLVEDHEKNLLWSLDRTLEKFRLDKGRDPDFVQLLQYPGEYFKHMTFNINFLGMQVPGSYTKPAWFRMKRMFRGAR